MLKPKVVIFGSSGHTKVIVDIIESESKFELLGSLINSNLLVTKF